MISLYIKENTTMEAAIKMFKALSDETRLRIYLLLLQGELCVCELVNILNMEQSRISHSVRILKEAGLVVNRREGKWIIYAVSPETENNRIIQSLKNELKLTEQDLKNITKCKKEKIREKFKCD
ncbi:MAG TPA: metalloregulator ArsR/SmtB family transcription factor [Candidatus Atribacteria bacterium]|nr:metalloregulator ArsR/SmtB family transcription factor [Candidatus Atribacteria bacterium]